MFLEPRSSRSYYFYDDTILSVILHYEREQCLPWTLLRPYNKAREPLLIQEVALTAHRADEAGSPAMTTADVWVASSERLRKFIRKRVASDSDADDILQDTFVKIHAGLSDLKVRGSLWAWLFRIARNTITDHYRAKRDTAELPEEFPEPQKGPATVQAAEEIAACLRPMVDRLPERYRRAIELTEYHGESQRDAAETLGLTVSGAKSRVQRARTKLRDMLLECCHVELDRLGHVIDYQPRSAGCHVCSRDDASP